jgi:hypothetical protein
MNIQQRAIIGAIIIAAFVFFTNHDKISNSALTNDEITNIITQTEKAFNEAESKILKNNPKPDDNKPVGPDPDAAKCICKGTGKIVQGDGHISPCPYHSSGESSQVIDGACDNCGNINSNILITKSDYTRKDVLNSVFGY